MSLINEIIEQLNINDFRFYELGIEARYDFRFADLVIRKTKFNRYEVVKNRYGWRDIFIKKVNVECLLRGSSDVLLLDRWGNVEKRNFDSQIYGNLDFN